MYAQITVQLEGEIIIDRVLQGLEDRMRDLSGAWPQVVQAFREIVARAFASEGASTGAPWAPLAVSTQAERRRLGFPPAHPILARTHALERSLTLGEGGFATMAPERLTIGTNVEYFVYHQSNRPRARLPRRAPVLLTADDRTQLVHPIRLWLTGHNPAAPRRPAFA